MRILLSAFNSQYVHSTLALYSLAAQIPGDPGGVRPMIREYSVNQDLQDVLGDVFVLEPDLIFLSLYIWNRRTTLDFIRDFHRIRPQCGIYLGGPEASTDPDTLLKEYPEIDGIFLGEGETPFRTFLVHPDLREHGKIRIPGLMRRGGQPVMAEPADMGKLRFPYGDRLPGDVENRILYYESGRGCPFHCAYCLSARDNRLRLRPVEKVLDELDFLLANGVRTIKFVDRTFNAERDRAARIWSWIRDRKECECVFHFEVSADILSPEHLDILGRMPVGRVQLEIGLQSFNPRVLEICGRKSNLERLEDTMRLLRKNRNIHLHLDLIAGLPGEDPESFEISFNRAFSLWPDMLQLGFLKVLKGTPMEQLAGEYGIVASARPPYQVLSTGSLSFRDLEELRRVEAGLEGWYNRRPAPLVMEKYAVRYPAGAMELFRTLGTGTSGAGREERFRRLYEVLSSVEEREQLKEDLRLDWVRGQEKKYVPEFLADSREEGLLLQCIREGRLPQPWAERLAGMNPKSLYRRLGLVRLSGGHLAFFDYGRRTGLYGDPDMFVTGGRK